MALHEASFLKLSLIEKHIKRPDFVTLKQKSLDSPNYTMRPIRRIIKIALACKIYVMITNFLTDIFFIDAISRMPISVGSGEAIRIQAKVTNKYTLTESVTLY